MLFDRARVAAALPAYELGDELGSGAFGVVVRARHRRLNRPVAVKVVHVADDEARQRFVSEAQLLAAIDHPHVVRVYDYVETDPLCLIVMELLDGGTLTRRRRTISAVDACAVGLAVAAALGSAHSHNVLHRDVKPDNVLFDDSDLVKTTDFGIAKVFAGDETTASMVAGTPRYMAPEQIVQGQLGPGTDLYALGVVLYELLTKRPVFDPKLPLFELYQRTLNTPPDPLDAVPSPVAAVVMRALAKDRDDRQPSAHAFALELASAGTLAFGPGWTARSDVRLRLDDDLRDRVGTAASPATAEPPPDGQTAPAHPVAPTPTTAPRPRKPPTSNTPPRPQRPSQPPPHASRSASAADPARDVRPKAQPEPAGHTAEIHTLAFSGDGQLLASCSDDGLVVLWEAGPAQAIPRRVAGFRPHARQVRALSLSPDGNALATTGGRGIQVWDLSDPTHPVAVAELAADADILALRFSYQAPAGLSVVDATPSVTSWDLRSLRRPQRVSALVSSERFPGLGLAELSPDGCVLAVAGPAHDVNVLNVVGSGGLRRAAVIYSSRDVRRLSFAADSRALAMAGATQTELWDVSKPSTPRRRMMTPTRSWRSSVQFGPVGRVLATTYGVGEAELWDAANLKRPRRLLTCNARGLATAFSADGLRLATSTADNQVAIYRIGRIGRSR